MTTTTSDIAAGWQPMATAPKDGTPILAFSPDDDFRDVTGMDVIWWEAVEECWFFGMSDEYEPMNSATHWMPLPAAPSQIEEG